MPQRTPDEHVIASYAASPVEVLEKKPATGGAASIRPVCEDIAARVNAFLDEELESEVLRAVQAQTRGALGVIGEALERYRYVALRWSELSGTSGCGTCLVSHIADTDTVVPQS